MRILWLAIALLLFGVNSPALQVQPADLAAHRAQLLHSGVNASMRFAQAHDYSPARLNRYTTDEGEWESNSSPAIAQALGLHPQ